MGFDRKLGTLVGFKFRKSDIYLGLDELLWVPDLLFSRSITTGPGLAYTSGKESIKLKYLFPNFQLLSLFLVITYAMVIGSPSFLHLLWLHARTHGNLT